ncbi:TonB-dependent receptor domain-containing protein [Granulosicoccus antarcticus]|uniref:TonB-dependent heme receptor A n=1 Tax=Granulosicoccus antarcticus IMCC3135 TaxID=1192854 RepID=A0A2Z2NJW1_9GAMM|nr:TonB-dependent receptor [Granulosicoccus antarcticus]ASJ71586.1 TonB-dependent heme receptor A [Granulosicoccus antarcticus IMCC3135]
MTVPAKPPVLLSRTLFAVLPLVLSMQQVYAQQLEGEEEPLVLGPMVVWGTQVQSSSVKLGSEGIGIKQADHISDLLRSVPGVDVGGAHSLNQRITIRSMDDKDLRISIDGANQNTYMYHHLGNLQIHADILESVDIDVGNNSVVNGGLGGSVRFRTKSAEQLLEEGQRAGGRVQLGYGDNSGTSFALTGYGQLTEAVDVIAYYNGVNRDNYEVGGGEIKDFSGNTIEGTDGTVRGLEGDLQDVLLKFGWDINDNHRLSFGVENYVDEGDYSYRPDMGLATDLAITESLGVPLLWPTELSRNTVTLNYEGESRRGGSINASLFRNDSTLQRDESGWAQNADFADSAGQIEGEAANTGVNVIVRKDLGQHGFSYGAEVTQYETDFSADYQNGSQEKSSEEIIDSAIFVQDRIRLNERFSLTPGVRYNVQKNDTVVTDDTFDEVTAALAADFELTPTVHLRASTTQLFKGPEIGEVFTGAGLYDSVNADIRQETGLNTELSLAYANAVLGADEFSAGFTLFNTQLDDYIYDYAPIAEADGGGSWKDNVGDMNVQGIEAYLGYEIGQLEALFSYSIADSELDADSEYLVLDKARLDRKQGDTFAIALDYHLAKSRLALHWDAQVVKSLGSGVDLDGATENNAKDGFAVHNISAKWHPTVLKGLSITVGIDNLFDEYYASQSSRTGLSLHPRFGELYLQDYEPGRNFKLTADYTF